MLQDVFKGLSLGNTNLFFCGSFMPLRIAKYTITQIQVEFEIINKFACC